jgi:hypothetical protein
MKKAKPQKDLHLEFVLLTVEEHAALVKQFGAAGALSWIEEMDDYLGLSETNRRKYESHYRAIRIWARKRGGVRGAGSGVQGDGSGRFIMALKESPSWPDMAPKERTVIYAVLQRFKMSWPTLRQRMIEEPTMEQRIKDVYQEEADNAVS